MKRSLSLTASLLRRVVKAAFLSSLIAVIVLGGWLINSSASQKRKLTLAEATTVEDNGKALKAKPGFQLEVKNQGRKEVVAFKVEKGVKLTSDTVSCSCKSFARCTAGGGSPCCSHTETERSRENCDVSLASGGGRATCSGPCDQCNWRQVSQ